MVSDVIRAAVSYLQQEGEAPAAADVVVALLAAEKHSKRAKQRYHYEQLLGAWRLGFVSGTQKVRPQLGTKPVKKPGKGRFLPRRLLNIEIAYGAAGGSLGTVENAVTAGPVQLRLTGPTRFWPKTNSLGFDFTHVQAKLGPLTVYEGAVRGGLGRNRTFKTQSLKDQAFFTFFRMEPSYIAARGKGGGLALWLRSRD